jgi:hypothetical protein
MKRRTWIYAVMVIAVSLLHGTAQSVDDAQKQAIAKYPDLVRDGSPLHSKFLELYHQAQEFDPTLLSDPNWPLILSDKASALLAADAMASQPSPSPSPTPEPSPAASPPPAPSPSQPTPAPSSPRPAKIDQGQTSAASTFAVAKDCVDIVFFFVVGTVAVLAFLQARKTLFMPIRTETFKLQLKAFEDVLLFFARHPSTHIDDEFDFDRIVYLNAIKMLDAYAVMFFGDQFRMEDFSRDREYLYQEISGEIVTKDFAENNFQTQGHFREEARDDTEQLPSEPALIPAKWKLYEHGVIHYTKPHQDAIQRLRRFNASPLLPRDLKALISDFDAAVSENLRKTGSMLTEVAKELPLKYPTFPILAKADLSWIWNKYNHTCVRLDDKQNAILTYLEHHLQIENLLERNDEPHKGIAGWIQTMGERFLKRDG